MFEALSQSSLMYRQEMMSDHHITQKKYGHKFASTNYRKEKCFITYKISHFLYFFFENVCEIFFYEEMTLEITSNNCSMSFPSKCCMYTIITKVFFGFDFSVSHPFRNKIFHESTTNSICTYNTIFVLRNFRVGSTLLMV